MLSLLQILHGVLETETSLRPLLQQLGLLYLTMPTMKLPARALSLTNTSHLLSETRTHMTMGRWHPNHVAPDDLCFAPGSNVSSISPAFQLLPCHPHYRSVPSIGAIASPASRCACSIGLQRGQAADLQHDCSGSANSPTRRPSHKVPRTR